jgi:outer membrane murein-binding lipoprotein Lpp
MFLIRRLQVLVLLSLLVLAGCVTTSRFDQHVYIQTTSIKVDALNVMDMAVEDYTSHHSEVRQVLTDLEKTYEYERNRKNNEITIKLWDKLKDTSGHLFGGFVKRWKNEKKLRPVFIQESKKQVGEAFDIIAQLESKKIKPKQVKD